MDCDSELLGELPQLLLIFNIPLHGIAVVQLQVLDALKEVWSDALQLSLQLKHMFRTLLTQT